MGRPGGARVVPVRRPTLGPARVCRPVPFSGGRPPPQAAAPDPGTADVPALAAGAAPLSGPAVRLRGRRRLRDPRGRPVLSPPPRPADSGQQAPPRGQPVRAAPAL